MKQLVLAVALCTTLVMAAQTHKDYKNEKMNMTVEEIATKRTEKLTKTLDLNETQQEQVMQLSLESAEKHKAKWEEAKAQHENGTWEKPTPEQRSEMQNKMAERQKELDQKMKGILTEEQHAKWRKMKDRQAKRLKKKRYNKRMDHNKRMDE